MHTFKSGLTDPWSKKVLKSGLRDLSLIFLCVEHLLALFLLCSGNPVSTELFTPMFL